MLHLVPSTSAKGRDRLRLLGYAHTPLLAGGSETVFLRTLQAARGAGWEVACVSPEGPLADELKALGAHWVPGPDLQLGSAPRPLAVAELAWRWLAGAPRLRRLCADVDLVLVNGIRALPALSVARPRARVVWLAHDVLWQSSYRRLARWSLGGVDEVVAVSRATAAPLQRLRVPTRVVYNGTPWPVQPAPPEPPRPLTIGNAAAMTPWKGQSVLIDALAQLERPDVHLELLGTPNPKDADYGAMLHRQVDRLGLTDRVHFPGQVSDAIEHMRRWAVAVVASTDPEPGPLVMIEAMSVGVPVVATAHGGPTELLGDAGLLVPPGDPAAMASAVARLLDDRALRQGCRQAGTHKVEQDLVLADRTAELLGVLADVATRAPSRRRFATRSHRPGDGRRPRRVIASG
jgi:glycosyltransferase involved in cell wall biosynthesis